MAKYRKKPVIIEAIRLERSKKGIKEAMFFMNRYGKGDSLNDGRTLEEKFEEYCESKMKDEGLKIETLEGDLLASWGDWIIRGIKGEFYPCKPDIFENTYEPAGE